VFARGFFASRERPIRQARFWPSLHAEAQVALGEGPDHDALALQNLQVGASSWRTRVDAPPSFTMDASGVVQLEARLAMSPAPPVRQSG